MNDLDKTTGQVLQDLSARLPALGEEVQRAWAAAFSKLLQPEQFPALSALYMKQAAELSELWRRNLDPSATAAVVADNRFSASEWRRLPFFRLLRDMHLLHARHLMAVFRVLDLDPAFGKRVAFVLRQALDAASPANFLATNPEAIALAHKTGNESLQHGLRQFSEDMARGCISMSDETAFEVGRNLAVTPGAVVYENDVMQLIQYNASTRLNRERPLFVVPPFINKYYILDLQPDNSFVRFCVEQGIIVFMVSWRNATGAESSHLSWDDYLQSGVLTPLEVAREIAGVEDVNVLGFCVGGTLLACALAIASDTVLRRTKSLTLLASMLDFSDTGDLGVFVDEAFVRKAEDDYCSGGIMPGKRLYDTFALLRANDLIWYFVVNNYLKGQKPRAFDLLYWNADSTNVPGPLYAYYLRNMYLENKLRQPGVLTMLGRKVDLGRLRLPVYALAARDDHIVPWRTAYRSAHLLAGPTSFVLAQSGHVAGIVSPPHGSRRGYARGGPLTDNPDAWLEGAEDIAGSWWPHWMDWLEPRSGQQRMARESPGSVRFPVLEPAPGRYVRARAS